MTGLSAAALAALLIFLLAALGGFYLASIHLRNEVARKAVVCIHAGAAVIGFLVLLGATARSEDRERHRHAAIGHPIHPILVHFPVAFWTVASVAYIADAAGAADADAIARVSNGAALIMALPAQLAGVLELRSIDSRSDAMRAAMQHMMVMATAWLCFLVALHLPMAAGAAMTHSTVQLAAAASAAAAFLLMCVGGWLGGRLVYHFGIGVKGREERQTNIGACT
jgi:uncharacterized membrane protein